MISKKGYKSVVSEHPELREYGYFASSDDFESLKFKIVAFKPVRVYFQINIDWDYESYQITISLVGTERLEKMQIEPFRSVITKTLDSVYRAIYKREQIRILATGLVIKYSQYTRKWIEE